ncbi:hypothetical protein M569_11819 [Genlisea aurea]|uniref:DUF3475 domain-containing protein n=1 Tax=Genlisea aurea TaxID=192259 RepID=S8C812_9LAMI|nr:hypothetical protein M569_11819 [Genlisea aurea]
MGSVCSGGILERNEEAVGIELKKSLGFSGKLKSSGAIHENNPSDEVSYTYTDEVDAFEKKNPRRLFDSCELHFNASGDLRHSTPASTTGSKASQMPSFLGKAGIVGLEKAVEVLDTLGSSMTSLNSTGFSTGVASRANRISILAFEVANTIAKGSTLLQSLSVENIRVLKKEIMASEGVKRLVSTDINELLLIAAADKREEFDVFSREVIRFGNLCKDPQWHNLDRFFLR